MTQNKLKTRIALALLALAAAISTFSAQARTLTITLLNGQTVTYDLSATSTDSIRYIGGEWGDPNGIGVKIYPKGSTVSHDYLYSQIAQWLLTGDEVTTVAMPVISPAGGTITTSTPVTITCATTGATIYYTLDGTNPVSSSTAFSGSSPVSFVVSSNANIRAIAMVGSTASEEATATFNWQGGSNNNVNANWWSSNWTHNTGSMSYTPQTAGFWRLEVPHISDNSSCSWVQKSTSNDGVTFALEWDNALVANRWTCYRMHAGNMEHNTTRHDSFKEDTELPSSTRSTLSDYSGSGFSRGHLCPSSDRLCSEDQNKQTFYLSNMQPQYQSHNGGQWESLENDVRSWAAMSNCDTLYVVKAATIGDVTLNGSTQSGLKNVLCNNRLIVPEYFYMALLAYNKTTGTYQAMGIWTYHFSETSYKRSAEYITIDELERRTGIDFFCNLPDDIEASVEASLSTSYWSSGASLNR